MYLENELKRTPVSEVVSRPLRIVLTKCIAFIPSIRMKKTIE